MGVGETGDPFGGCRECDSLGGEAGPDREGDREVYLAVPGGPRRITFSLACRKSSCPRCSNDGLLDRALEGVSRPVDM